MADEKTAPAPKKGGMGMVVTAVIVIVSVAGGIGVEKFVLQPRVEQAAVVPVEEQITEEKIPGHAATIQLEQAQATVRPDEPDGRSGVLQYSVSIVCANEETLKLVEKHKQWFVAMLVDLHRNRTRSELADPEMKKSLAKQALEEANSILRRFDVEEAKEEPKIIQVLYTEFNVFDMP